MNERLHTTWQIRPADFPTGASAKEQVSFLLRYAILAPSVHNTQPWQCCITDNQLEVFYDPSRHLTVSDPTYREGMLSMGAFCANYVVAARAFHLRPQLEWLPEGSENRLHVARITITPRSEAADPDTAVLQSMLDRRMNRYHYTKKALTRADVLRAIGTREEKEIEVTVVDDTESRGVIRHLIAKAAQFAFSNKEFRGELSDYIVPNTSNRDDGIPGYAANLGVTQSLLTPHIIRNFNTGISQGIIDASLFYSAPVAVIVSSATDEQEGWLRSGFAFEELALKVTAHGYSYSIIAAPIEAPMSAQKLQKKLALSTRPQIIFGVGYAPKKAPHSPRRKISDILI